MCTFRFSQHSKALSLLLVSLALLATACGGSDGSSTTGVASLEDVAAAEVLDPTAGEDNATLSADEAALQFSQCMRDEGLDFPDIGVDAEGNPNIGAAFSAAGIEPRSEEFQDAIGICGDTLAGAGFGGGRPRGLADNVEIQDALVEFSGCLRDEGLDVGDLQLGGPPEAPEEGQDSSGDTPEDRGARRQQGFGDRGGRIANALGLDAEDPDTAAALEKCNPILDTAFANFGPGAPGTE